MQLPREKLHSLRETSTTEPFRMQVTVIYRPLAPQKPTLVADQCSLAQPILYEAFLRNYQMAKTMFLTADLLHHLALSGSSLSSGC
jgi:hypothetical protein